MVAWIGHYSQEVPAGHDERIKMMAKREDIPITPEVRKLYKNGMARMRGIPSSMPRLLNCEYGAQPNADQIVVYSRCFPKLVIMKHSSRRDFIKTVGNWPGHGGLL
jgi:hypothetical protein